VPPRPTRSTLRDRWVPTPADVDLDPDETTALVPERRPTPDRRTSGRAATAAVILTVLALLLWLAVVFIGRIWGLYLEAEGHHHLVLYTPPILGGYRPSVPPSLWLPLVIGGVLVLALPSWLRNLPWRSAVFTGVLAALGWWVALALVDGVDGLTAGIEWDADFADVIPAIVAHPLDWLRGFVASVPNDGIQIRAHPPGLPLLLAGMDRLGLRGPGWAATAVLASAAAGVVAVLVAVREVAGEDVARRAIPFVALAPAAIWIATSFDALYVGTAAWFVTLLILATRREGRRSDTFAIAAGLMAAATIMLSYGLVLMGAVALLAVVGRRRWRPVLLATGTAVLAILAFVPFGFWWIAGLAATRDAYYALGLDRPYSYFLLNDVSAWALTLGPATAVALVRLRDRRLWLLVGGALAAVAMADISGLSTGEVERIWLPFTIWVVPAGAALATGRWVTRGWLALQVTSALVLTALIRPIW
jgi:hypothetical protein